MYPWAYILVVVVVGGLGGMHLPWELLALDSWCGIVGKKVHPISDTHVIIIRDFCYRVYIQITEISQK